MNSYLKSKLHLFKNLLSKKKTVISDSSIKEYKILKKICKKRNLKLIDINTKKMQLKINFDDEDYIFKF